jgi:hypothetical protein
MEGSFSTGQSPQRAVVPVEEEEEYISKLIPCMLPGLNFVFPPDIYGLSVL